jgi:hypothetical protein
MINAARDAKQRFDELLVRASVHDTGEARVSAIYLLTISEQFAAVLHLVDGGFSTHALGNVRSMLEGLSYLLNVVKNPGYVDQIRFDSASADVALFQKCAIEPKIRDGESFAALKVSASKAQIVLNELKAKGIKRKDIIEQFRQAGIAENYVAYRILSSYAHNQLTTLLERHAGDLELLYCRPPSPETTDSAVIIALSILCQAINTLPQFTDVPAFEATRAIDDVNGKFMPPG